MSNLALRRSFAVFHLTLGSVIFIESVRTALANLHGHGVHSFVSHLSLLAGIEAVAAVLFLVPKTLRIGSVLLLIIFTVAIVVHGIQHELNLLVYAAGVIFVTVHGNGFTKEIL